jgi:hypothetical protein
VTIHYKAAGSPPAALLLQVIRNKKRHHQKVEAAGIEREDPMLQPVLLKELTDLPVEVSALCLHGERTTCQPLAANDNELNLIIELCPSLPEPTKGTIYTLCIDAVLLGE